MAGDLGFETPKIGQCLSRGRAVKQSPQAIGSIVSEGLILQVGVWGAGITAAVVVWLERLQVMVGISAVFPRVHRGVSGQLSLEGAWPPLSAPPSQEGC